MSEAMPDQPTQLDRIEAMLERLFDELESLKPVVNSQSESLNWLTKNTAGLFDGFKDMMANGGPAALLGSIGRKG